MSILRVFRRRVQRVQPDTICYRVFMRATVMPDDQRVLDYLEWAYKRAYGGHLDRDMDAADS